MNAALKIWLEGKGKDFSQVVSDIRGFVMKQRHDVGKAFSEMSGPYVLKEESSVRTLLPYTFHARRVFLARRVDAAWKVYANFRVPHPPAFTNPPDFAWTPRVTSFACFWRAACTPRGKCTLIFVFPTPRRSRTPLILRGPRA